MFFTRRRELRIQDFPSPEELWQRYSVGKGFANNPAKEELITENYHYVKGDKTPRYYQRIAINRMIRSNSEWEKTHVVSYGHRHGKNIYCFPNYLACLESW